MTDVQELVSWLLPSVYIALIGVIYGFYALVKKRSQNDHSKYTPVGDAPLDLADIRDNGTVPLLSHADGGSGAGNSSNEDDVEPEEGMETWTVTETGALWATVGLTLLLAVYHGAKAVIEAVDGGDRSDVTMHAVLCASSVIAAACRDADHWQHSPEYVGPAPHAPSPRRRRAWLWLFPYFNLTFVTALLRYVRGDSGGATSFVDYMSQDELWALVAQGACLVLVTHSVLVGARVTRLYHAPNAEYKAGIFSWLMFSWFTPIIARGQRKQLGLPDLPPQMTWDRSRYVWWRFVRTAGQQRSAKKKRQQQQQQRSGGPGLALRLFRLVRPLFVAQGLWQLLATLAEFTSPLAMQQIVDFVGTYTGGAVDARTTFFVGLLFVGPVVQGIADGRNFHMGRRIGCRVRSALVGAIFRKMLRSDMSSASYSAGELTNLMSVDAAAVLEFSGYTHFMWTTSLSVLLCVGLLFYVLGVSAFGGVAFMLLSIPLGKWTTSKTQWTTSKMQTYQRQLMKDKDARMGVVGEVLQGIRIIKLFAWEKNFLGRISEARGAEMASLRGYMIMMAGVIVQWNSVTTLRNSITTLVGLCTFLVHTRLLGKSLSASQGFTSLALFNLLRFPLLVLPDVFNFYLQAKVSLDRIEAFLYRDEWSHPPKKEGGDEGGEGAGSGDAADDAPLLTSSGDASAAVEVEDVALLPPTLVGIDLEAGPGQLVCIYGPTGCGKSSLLMGDWEVPAILGEVRRLEGTVQVGGRIAYASQRAWIQNASLRDNVLFGAPYDPIWYNSVLQRAWIQNASLRDNILFGAPYDPVWYNSVLQACALAPDLELLEAGDMTEIGERGVNLSGGQQQRVSLARALYANADVYLLDDMLSPVDMHAGPFRVLSAADAHVGAFHVLSAVDAHVGEHLFKRCVRDLLVTRGKTVVMVSHQIALTAR
ncbi:ABC transporter type 1, transmembrane domain-containing protein [Tribonema minus]|uniref:ABC transporter type 1, transmembrane domain-containing protein n=1 Tax=Tribonema minus TaxID=303371 RepID=A0A836CN62_9STRA|nr:ABC transporter type 1, transmembrane domain-containing protein [Tribonema minus]